MKKRFLFYSQHLSGTGHFVRTFEIAQTLAASQDVYMFDGGRKVPRPHYKNTVHLIELPRIYRNNGIISAVDDSDSINAIMLKRKQRILESISEIRPDVLIVEHFPFSKWSLYDEIICMVKHLKTINCNTKIICSVRDIVNGTCDQPNNDYGQKITHVLHKYFDLIFVHSDPSFISLKETLPTLTKINIPIHYTGYVSEKPEIKVCKQAKNNIIVSTGGKGSTNIINHCIDAWRSCDMKEIAQANQLTIFSPLNAEYDKKMLTQINNSINIIPYSTNFLSILRNASLLISEAGYNTCMNILETKIPSLLIPNTEMSDQLPRARKLNEYGLANTLETSNLNTVNLVKNIKSTLYSSPSIHNINLNGAEQTASLLNDC